jgi:hypothetical protein
VPLFLSTALEPANADVHRIEDAYTATTTGMTPAGLALRLQVIQWSDDAARADVIGVLDDGPALAKLPTVGYVWPAGSPVGYTVKYAHRSPTADGRERITLVTDKPLGSYDYKKWSVAGAAPQAAATYSVIELYVDSSGNGVGNLSLATEVIVDEAASTISLASGGSANLLANVERQPRT